MWTIRKMIMIGAAAIAAGAAWLVESAAQENTGAGVVSFRTYPRSGVISSRTAAARRRAS
jgi:hypothetical protein